MTQLGPKFKVGDRVRLVRFGRVGVIICIVNENKGNIAYIVQYNAYESEAVYEWELELA